MQSNTRSRMLSYLGWIMSGWVLLFLLADGAMKLLLTSAVVEATTGLGYPEHAIRPIGAICLTCAVLYAIPRTAVLGAILMTGFLGGAVASQVRVEAPLFSSTLFGIYVGLMAWGGLFLRIESLRGLIPLRRSNNHPS